MDRTWWQCAVCGDVLRLEEIWHHGSGALLCQRDFEDWTGSTAWQADRPDPRLCSECGNPLIPLEEASIKRLAKQGIPDYGLCTSCNGDSDPEAIKTAVDRLLNLLDEEN